MGGIVGPIGFVTAWLVAGARQPGYDPIDTAISRLAATDAPHRLVMTSGFVVFAVGLGAFALGLRTDPVDRRAWGPALAAAVATAAVALLPLGRSATIDTAHGVAAGSGYVALVGVPLIAAPARRAAGRPMAAGVARGIGVVAGLALLATLVDPVSGVAQRAGLTLVDGWLVVAGIEQLRHRDRRPGRLGPPSTQEEP